MRYAKWINIFSVMWFLFFRFSILQLKTRPESMRKLLNPSRGDIFDPYIWLMMQYGLHFDSNGSNGYGLKNTGQTGWKTHKVYSKYIDTHKWFLKNEIIIVIILFINNIWNIYFYENSRNNVKVLMARPVLAHTKKITHLIWKRFDLLNNPPTRLFFISTFNSRGN